MKVFFSLASSKWARDSGYAKKWESFVTSLKQEDRFHSITDNKGIADVIIDVSDERLGSSTLRAHQPRESTRLDFSRQPPRPNRRW
jgi:hypothetical protein